MFLDVAGGLHGMGKRAQGSSYSDEEGLCTLRKLEFDEHCSVADVKKIAIGKMQRYVLMNNGQYYFMGMNKHYVAGINESSRHEKFELKPGNFLHEG